MKLLNKITDDSSQQFTLIGDDGEQISFLLFFMPSQQSWFFNLSYGAKTINGIKVILSPNILHNYKNILPFGIGCLSSDGMEPFYIDDFSTQRIRMYLLNAQDVSLIDTGIFGD